MVKLTELLSSSQQDGESLDDSKAGFDSVDNDKDPFVESSLSIEEVEMDDCSL